MIEVTLQLGCSNSLYFDAVPRGLAAFSVQEDRLIGQMSPDQFADFLKDNNLITYRDSLKSYESGEKIGEFTPL